MTDAPDAPDGPLWAVVGPTATGKSALALELAEQLGGEVVCLDSAQVFRGLDVGTAKPTAAEQARVPHHLLDVLEPDAQWSAADYARAADEAIAVIRGRGRVPLLCGGTGLWLRALTRGIFEAPPIDHALREAIREELRVRGPEALHRELAAVDPAAAARIHPTDPQRIGRALEVHRQAGIPISELQAAHGFRAVRHRLVAVALEVERALLAERIAARARAMYAGGLLEETAACLARGISREAPGLRTIGYRDAVRCLTGELDRAAAEEATIVATRQYAKRQRNWFRHEPEVAWVPAGTSPAQVHAMLRQRSSSV
jgi:tRNA dimethylallyltransferase